MICGGGSRIGRRSYQGEGWYLRPTVPSRQAQNEAGRTLPTGVEADLAALLTRLINERAGLEVGAVVPIKRIPKTTSGKIQRQALKESFENGEFDGELKELAALRAAQRGPGSTSRTQIEDRLKSICDAALEGKRIDVHDNLFEIGASSLKLIEIHEQIDREYPGQVELTELFDYPTIAELAQHLQSKLA